jgi:RNA polymerase sigma factor (TIGR02999 family)
MGGGSKKVEHEENAGWYTLPGFSGPAQAGYSTSSVSAMNEVTRILSDLADGEACAAARLLPLVYDELRRLAAARLAAEPSGNTLQPTALVHEAYLRLVASPNDDRWDHRGHFFAAAAEAMRRILVDAARRKGREKHGGDWTRVDLEVAQPAARDLRHDLVALDAALTRLAVVDAPAAKLIELRHFAGLSITEAAQVLGVSARTADRLWAFARAWLHRELTDTDADPRS